MQLCFKKHSSVFNKILIYFLTKKMVVTSWTGVITHSWATVWNLLSLCLPTPKPYILDLRLPIWSTQGFHWVDLLCCLTYKCALNYKWPSTLYVKVNGLIKIINKNHLPSIVFLWGMCLPGHSIFQILLMQEKRDLLCLPLLARQLLRGFPAITTLLFAIFQM